MDLNPNDSAGTDGEPLATKLPTTEEPEDPRSVQLWYLRRAQRALGFARHMLREAIGDCERGAAHARVTYSMGRADVQAGRAFDRLAKDLRRLRSPRLYQWIGWQRGSDAPKGLHGEAHTLNEAKAHALRALQELEEGSFYSAHSKANAVALVTGPAGARHELRRAYRRDGAYCGFRWYARGRPVTACALGGLAPPGWLTMDPFG